MKIWLSPIKNWIRVSAPLAGWAAAVLLIISPAVGAGGKVYTGWTAQRGQTFWYHLDTHQWLPTPDSKYPQLSGRRLPDSAARVRITVSAGAIRNYSVPVFCNGIKYIFIYNTGPYTKNKPIPINNKAFRFRSIPGAMSIHGRVTATKISGAISKRYHSVTCSTTFTATTGGQ